MSEDPDGLVFELYDQGLDQPAEEREVWLKRQCPDQPEVRAEVLGLWAAHEEEIPDNQASATRSWESIHGVDRSMEWDDFRLDEKIGRGGMGVVYRAWQHSLDRNVAIKILSSMLTSPEHRWRFQIERMALARMDHANVATVIKAGTTPDGHPYYAMEYLADGHPITEYCNDHRLTIDQRLALFAQVCSGTHHAHQKGVIHRDLKPGNILVVEKEGQPIPKIIDFGIARLADDERFSPNQTRSGDLVGTPAYMSPEAAAGRSEDVDTRSDVYSLGILLYEMVTGIIPRLNALQGVSAPGWSRVILETPIPPPARALDEPQLARQAALCRTSPAGLRTRLGAELAWIIHKALSLDPAERYNSCQAFLEDIERYLQGYPVQAGPRGRLYALRKFIGRNRLAVGLSLSVFSIVLIALLATSWSLYHAKKTETRLLAVNGLYHDIFAEVSPYKMGRDVRAYELLQRADQLIEDSYGLYPDLEAAKRQVVGRSYAQLSLHDQAVPQLEKALHIHRKLRGPNHAHTLLSPTESCLVIDAQWGPVPGRRSFSQGLEDLTERARCQSQDNPEKCQWARRGAQAPGGMGGRTRSVRRHSGAPGEGPWQG